MGWGWWRRVKGKGQHYCAIQLLFSRKHEVRVEVEQVKNACTVAYSIQEIQMGLRKRLNKFAVNMPVSSCKTQLHKHICWLLDIWCWKPWGLREKSLCASCLLMSVIQTFATGSFQTCNIWLNDFLLLSSFFLAIICCSYALICSENVLMYSTLVFFVNLSCCFSLTQSKNN